MAQPANRAVARWGESGVGISRQVAEQHLRGVDAFPELDDNDPIEKIAADIVWMVYEAVAVHGYTEEQAWRLAFPDD